MGSLDDSGVPAIGKVGHAVSIALHHDVTLDDVPLTVKETKVYKS